MISVSITPDNAVYYFHIGLDYNYAFGHYYKYPMGQDMLDRCLWIKVSGFCNYSIVNINLFRHIIFKTSRQLVGYDLICSR